MTPNSSRTASRLLPDHFPQLERHQARYALQLGRAPRLTDAALRQRPGLTRAFSWTLFDQNESSTTAGRRRAGGGGVSLTLRLHRMTISSFADYATMISSVRLSHAPSRSDGVPAETSKQHRRWSGTHPARHRPLTLMVSRMNDCDDGKRSDGEKMELQRSSSFAKTLVNKGFL